MDRIIKVTGKGKISVKPDTIKLNIEAEGVYKEYEQAVKRKILKRFILTLILNMRATEIRMMTIEVDLSGTSTLTACTSNF